MAARPNARMYQQPGGHDLDTMENLPTFKGAPPRAQPAALLAASLAPPCAHNHAGRRLLTLRDLFCGAEVPNSERANLFVRKLRLCSIICDFTEGAGNDRDKEIKRQVPYRACRSQQLPPSQSAAAPSVRGGGKKSRLRLPSRF